MQPENAYLSGEDATLNNSGTSLIHANFFFLDAVGLSDPNMSTRTQLKKVEAIHEIIKNSQIYKMVPQSGKFTIPTGDGMCIGFLQGIDLPIKLAIEVQKRLDEYNQGKIPAEIIKVRIGLHRGDCFEFANLNDGKSVWGPGIILAKRIMDIGEDGHILLSSSYAESLLELFDEYRKIVRPMRDYTLKHNITMLVYSACGKNFGNPKLPEKYDLQKSKLKEETLKRQNTTLYPKISVNLAIVDPKSMLVKHKRTYNVANISDEPIKFVLHGIGTDVPKNSINDLDLKVYDDNNKEMKISSINLDRPYTKEFSTVFERPILKSDSGRGYTLEYLVEEPERFYENAFLIDCKKFVLGFSYPEGSSVKPTLYEINQETEEKTKFEEDGVKEKTDGIITVSWQIDDVVKGQTFRIEW